MHHRKLVMITHGVGMLMVLVAGFGLLAKLGTSQGTGWVIGKLVLWLSLGAVIVVLNRRPQWARSMWYLIPILGGLAVYLAVYKPF